MATRSSVSPGLGLAASARILSRAPGARVGIDTLKAIAMLCGVGLFVSLLLAANGLDMTAGFF
jgi:hypothetical protein